MKLHNFNQFCCNLFFLFLFLFLVAGTYSHLLAAESDQIPVVILEQFSPPTDKNLEYLGPALTEMVKIRLESQGIDVIKVGHGDQKRIKALSNLGDLLLKGKIQKNNQIIDLAVQLFPMDSTGSEQAANTGAIKPLKTWRIRAQNLSILSRRASLLTGELADVIRDSHQLLIARKETALLDEKLNKAALSSKSQDNLEMTRIHPDRLVRERLAKDQAKEMKEIGLPMPENSTGNTHDSIARSESTDETQASGSSPAPPSEHEWAQLHRDQQPRRSWWSYLWPFGSEAKKQQETMKIPQSYQAVTADQGRFGRDLSELEKAEKPIYLPKDKLPVPPPKNEEFRIPDPQSVDDVLNSAVIIEKKNREKRSWFSFLMPWKRDNRDYEIIVNQTDLGGEPLPNLDQASSPLPDPNRLSTNPAIPADSSPALEQQNKKAGTHPDKTGLSRQKENDLRESLAATGSNSSEGKGMEQKEESSGEERQKETPVWVWE